MDFKGRFKDFTKSWDGTGTLSFTVLNISTDYLQDIVDKDLRITVKQWKEKRSLSANAYFHVLCDKLRQKLGISMARCKNHLIADYGQIEYIDDEPMIYKTNCPEERMMELETIHAKCIKITEEKGKQVYFYRIYRGSHTYDSAEMARLIDGTVEECKTQGIETMTHAELERLVKMWNPS
jgi:hypothetical protein